MSAELFLSMEDIKQFMIIQIIQLNISLKEIFISKNISEKFNIIFNFYDWINTFLSFFYSIQPLLKQTEY